MVKLFADTMGSLFGVTSSIRDVFAARSQCILETR